jgi:hypothetical protein
VRARPSQGDGRDTGKGTGAAPARASARPQAPPQRGRSLETGRARALPDPGRRGRSRRWCGRRPADRCSVADAGIGPHWLALASARSNRSGRAPSTHAPATRRCESVRPATRGRAARLRRGHPTARPASSSALAEAGRPLDVRAWHTTAPPRRLWRLDAGRGGRAPRRERGSSVVTPWRRLGQQPWWAVATEAGADRTHL